MHFDDKEQAFILDGADRAAIGVPSELAFWPLEDAGHLFEEIACANQRIAELQSWYPGASVGWIAQERVRRFESLAKMREVLVAHAFSLATPEDIPGTEQDK